MATAVDKKRIAVTLPLDLIEDLRQEATKARIEVSEVIVGHLQRARELYANDERLVRLEEKLDALLDIAGIAMPQGPEPSPAQGGPRPKQRLTSEQFYGLNTSQEAAAGPEPGIPSQGRGPSFWWRQRKAAR